MAVALAHEVPAKHPAVNRFGRQNKSELDWKSTCLSVDTYGYGAFSGHRMCAESGSLVLNMTIIRSKCGKCFVHF